MHIGIVAVSKDGVIGLDGQLPWDHIPEDMALFKHLTSKHIVVMGKNTYYSLPHKNRPLKDRINVVLTHEKDLEFVYSLKPDTFTACSLTNLKTLHPNKHIFFIGGMQVYKKAIENKWIDRWIVTRVHHEALSSKKKHQTITHWDENLLKGFKLEECSPLGKTNHYHEVYERVRGE